MILVLVPGCTDINATNYDPNGTTDDGSCTYPDCNGIAGNGLAMIDDCGDCQSALVYDYVTHVICYFRHYRLCIWIN